MVGHERRELGVTDEGDIARTVRIVSAGTEAIAHNLGAAKSFSADPDGLVQIDAPRTLARPRFLANAGSAGASEPVQLRLPPRSGIARCANG